LKEVLKLTRKPAVDCGKEVLVTGGTPRKRKKGGEKTYSQGDKGKGHPFTIRRIYEGIKGEKKSAEGVKSWPCKGTRGKVAKKRGRIGAGGESSKKKV